MSLRRAMESAMVLLKADIDADFQILHIDTSVDIHGRPSTDEVLDRVFELYEFCWNYAQKVGRKILFEVGTEEQSGSTYAQEEISMTLENLKRFCLKNKLPLPFFVVIQNGTRVMETRNVGSPDSPLRVADEIPPEIQIPKMVAICQRFGILMKVHNTDYLSDDALQWYPRLGIHASNVAPEFGVIETKAFIGALERFLLFREVERFLQSAYESKKWNKWMLSDTKATDRDRAIIAGHYVFSYPEVLELKEHARKTMSRQGFELNSYLKYQVKRLCIDTSVISD